MPSTLDARLLFGLRARGLGLLYLAFGTLFMLLLATAMPALQNADEAAHAYRADQVSHFGLMGGMLPDGQFGGMVDGGLVVLDRRMRAMPFHQDVKMTAGLRAPIGWGARVAAGFPNSAINPPFFYGPAAMMAAVARGLGISLPHALVLMRLGSGFVAVAISAWAIALSGNAAIWLFGLLLLPMSAAVGAAVTEDGLMLACSALAAALVIRARGAEGGCSAGLFVSVCVLLAMVGMGRPPYAAFCVLLLAMPVREAWRVAGVGLVVLCVAGWMVVSARHMPMPPSADGVVSPRAQLLGLAAHWWQAPGLVVGSFFADHGRTAMSFIGQLGWLDVNLPGFYRKLAWVGLGFAAIAAVARGAGAVQWDMVAVGVLAGVGAAVGVALAQYATWTVVGAPVINGLQGRYFLPAAVMAAVVLARGGEQEGGVGRWAVVPVVALPVLSIAVSVHAVMARYYF